MVVTRTKAMINCDNGAQERVYSHSGRRNWRRKGLQESMLYQVKIKRNMFRRQKPFLQIEIEIVPMIQFFKIEPTTVSLI